LSQIRLGTTKDTERGGPAHKAINAFLAAVSLDFDAWSCFPPDSLITVYRRLSSIIQAHSINTWFIFQTLKAGLGQGNGINLGHEKYLMSTYRF